MIKEDKTKISSLFVLKAICALQVITLHAPLGQGGGGVYSRGLKGN